MTSRLGKGLDAIIPAQEKGISEKGISEKGISEKGISDEVKSDKLQQAVREANKQPRITVWSPLSKAVLSYFRKTTPEFSVSEVARKILEEGVRKMFPDISKLADEQIK